MQFSSFTLVAALMASLTYAQTIQQELAKIPACGMTCLATAAQAAGCGATDFNCQCGSGREAITRSAIPCVTSSCQPSDLTTITQASTEICRLNALAGITGSGTALFPSATSIAGIIATSVSNALSSATESVLSGSGTQTQASASPSSTGNAGNVVKFGAAGVAVGMGAVFAAFAL